MAGAAVAGEMLQAAGDAQPPMFLDPGGGMAGDRLRVIAKAAAIAANDWIFRIGIQIDHRREIEIDAQIGKHFRGLAGGGPRGAAIGARGEERRSISNRETALGLETADRPALLIDGDEQIFLGQILEISDEFSRPLRIYDVIFRTFSRQMFIKENDAADPPGPNRLGDDAAAIDPVAAKTDHQAFTRQARHRRASISVKRALCRWSRECGAKPRSLEWFHQVARWRNGCGHWPIFRFPAPNRRH